MSRVGSVTIFCIPATYSGPTFGGSKNLRLINLFATCFNSSSHTCNDSWEVDEVPAKTCQDNPGNSSDLMHSCWMVGLGPVA